MTLELLNRNTIQVTDRTNLDWKEAIELAADPLIKNDYIEHDYVDNMIKTVKKVGPYFNIGPGIALAHSRPIPSVKKISLSLLKTNHSVDLLDKKHPIKLWFVLAATDNRSHLKIIQELSNLLMNSVKRKKLMEAISVNEIEDILKN